ncbi:flagellar protein [Bacillus stratosphericus LAMA 585]|nr:flagellar protein [Bacillus stratosphericus LAMA 585]
MEGSHSNRSKRASPLYWGISMSIVDQLHDQTLKMAAEIEANPQSETLVEDFDAFLVERDELMRDIQHELSVQEKEKIKEIIQTDQLMAKQLTEIQNGIKADIQAIQRKKTKQLNYQNPYQPMTSDGVYYDKRK